jgi:hypothetical protein
VVKEPVTARAKHISERADAGLDLAEQKLDHARTSLANAAERLENVKDERRQLPRDSRPGDFARMAVARTWPPSSAAVAGAGRAGRRTGEAAPGQAGGRGIGLGTLCDNGGGLDALPLNPAASLGNRPAGAAG